MVSPRKQLNIIADSSSREVVVALGFEGVRFAIGGEEVKAAGGLDFSDAVQGDSAEAGRNLPPLGRWDGEEQLVVFAAIQRQRERIRRVGKGRRRNPVCEDECSYLARIAEPLQVDR
jgi:hypothetical protein